VASFTAWHWLDPQVRMAKATNALRAGGTLAVVATHHVAGGTEEFFVRAQECYEQWDPKTPPGLRLPPAASLPADSSEFAACGLFGRVEHRRYAVDITYTRAEYLDLLSTYSGHIRPSAQSCPPALVAGECHLFRRCQCRTPFVYSRGALASPCTG
jgi:hypothetical protein